MPAYACVQTSHWYGLGMRHIWKYWIAGLNGERWGKWSSATKPSGPSPMFSIQQIDDGPQMVTWNPRHSVVFISRGLDRGLLHRFYSHPYIIYIQFAWCFWHMVGASHSRWPINMCVPIYGQRTWASHCILPCSVPTSHAAFLICPLPNISIRWGGPPCGPISM